MPSQGSSTLEVALCLPLLFFLVFAVVGATRLTQGQMAVSGVAREAARAGALADSPGEARDRGLMRGREVASGYDLRGPILLSVEPGGLAPGGEVTARASYTVSFGDLPGLGWARVTVRSTQVEPVEEYRSRRRPR